jgi:hypothetical protein
MTCAGVAQDADRCAAAGMDGDLAKPLRYRALAEALERLLPALAERPAAPGAEDPPSSDAPATPAHSLPN